MTLDDQDIRAITFLACRNRPPGARQWREDKTAAEIAKLRDRNALTVAMAVLRCAADRGAERPECITSPGSHWGDTMIAMPPPTGIPDDEKCSICQRSRDACRIRTSVRDHEFLSVVDARRRAAGPDPERLAAIKADLQPTSGPTAPLTAEDFEAKNPVLHERLEAVRAALPGVRVDPALEREPVQDPEQGDEPTECDHPGIGHDHPWSYTGICPQCRKCKFIGHGPLCVDCYDATPSTTERDPEQGTTEEEVG